MTPPTPEELPFNSAQSRSVQSRDDQYGSVQSRRVQPHGVQSGSVQSRSIPSRRIQPRIVQFRSVVQDSPHGQYRANSEAGIHQGLHE